MTDRVEWVEIIEPKTQRPMYGNLRTGELAWEPPSSAKVKKRDNNQWWELFDPKTSRFYYYNEMLQKTVWHRPTNCDIIPLAKLQTLKLNTEARQDDAEVHKHKQQHSQRHRHRHREDNRHARHHHHHHQQQQGPPRGLPHDNERMEGDGQAELIGQPVRQRRASDQVERSRFNELATAHSMGYHHQGVMHGSPRGQRSQRYVQEMPGMPIPPNMQQQPQYPLPQVPYAHQGRMRSDSEPMDISKVRGDMQGQPPNFSRYPTHGGRGGYELGSVGRSAGHAIQEVMQREGSGGNLSQGSDHSQERHRPDSRASQSSHQSTEGYGPQRRRSLEMQGQHVHERSDSQVSTVSQGEERHRTAPSPRSKKKKQMPKMGVTAAMQRTFGGPTSPNANLPHSQSGERLQHFFGQPPRNQLPPQIQTQPPNTQGFIGPGYHRNEQESPRLASPMDSSFSPPGSNNFNRTATPDSSSSLDSSSQYPSTKDRHLVPSYGAGFPDQRGEHIVHKHSDSQLSQNSQTSISSHHSDSSNRPVTSDSQRSQSSEDLNGPTYVHVGPPSQEDHILSHRHSPAMQAPNNNLPPQLSTDTDEIMPSDPIYANLEFIAQREKEDEQRMVLREMDRLSGAQDIEIKIHRNHSGSPMGRINGEHENRSYSLEALDQHEQLAKAGIRLNKSFDSEESSSRDASVTHESSPMNTPGSPPSPTSHDTHSMESPLTETVHASLQRGGHHRGSTTSSTSGVNMIQTSVFERSISVQDQRPISMQKTGTVPHGLKNSPSLIAITRGGNKKGILPGENDLENVAPDNLNRHKKGLFRKKISLSNMLSWTKEPIRKSMLMTEDKAVKREAPEVFKLTQCYMGDRVIKGHTRDYALLDLVVKGWSIVPLRDEVYIQVCRQTSENYQEDSLRSGWELMAILLYFFPPSVSFHPYLESYIVKHLAGDFDTRKFVCCVSQVTVKDYAEQCMKRLDRVAQFGARKGNKKISSDEIAIAKNSIFFPSLFGNTLEEALELQKDRFPDYSLPWIVVVLSEEVLRLNGQRCEGIFRVPGDIDEVNSLKLKCDQWVHPECSDPHVPASLLKQWYRDLYTPLIPDEFYERCIVMCNDKDGALEVVEDLPDLNRHVLSHFIRFLQIFAHEEHVALTKMDVNNLAMVMAPNCLRCISDQPEIIFENTRKEMSFVRLLIQYLDTSYMVDIH
ncbi:uncharacterized protein LOC593776 isoform X3 [Strongylocentrotus purpuratus]|uniref:Rho GTPase-activating protein 39 n=1 Tax=Strongylocentrotus purpuratus TaxID=7668 RepID=A0A7M7PDH1_STRPU|nr:uncharacterized protein LOC593776 isoform X3 [Strongylocentrotus purpuratus]